MKKAVLALAVACSGFLMNQVAQAQEGIDIVPYAEVGTVGYQLTFDGSVPLPDGTFIETENSFNFDMLDFTVGAVASMGKFYANVNYRGTDEDSDDQIIPGLPTIKWSGDRQEWSAAFGYNLADQINVFAGYRDSLTEGSSIAASEYSFEHDGYFLGASYRIPITESGGLTLSVGHAWLDCEIEETLYGFEVPPANGDGSGIKFGISWRAALTEKWGYSVGVERFDYDYDLSGEGVRVDVEEIETSISVGMFYVL
ncbi:hypothetical protein FV139_09605 [Parahaliea maris]|uniref:Outer membrane protein beta-barrel domain-containing protein n=1 Tax=Parahaliea maris TaxID=2716870 RepID=A0A5C9A2N6_9GAMM|nr:hypothetical protein [Parahaliea maris]TXS93877.1 hypothetical protein FV139_09605 [Parahaliea maris]